MFITNFIGISIFILYGLYLFNGYETILDSEIMYFDGLMGFFNKSNTIYDNVHRTQITFLFLMYILITVRFISQLTSLLSVNPFDIAMNISLLVSNIVNIIMIYVLMNLVIDVCYLENSTLSIIICFIVSTFYLGYILFEFSSHMDGSGAIGLRDYLEDYLPELQSYMEIKRKLTENYKKTIK